MRATTATHAVVCSLFLLSLAVMPALADDYELHYDADGPTLNDVCALVVDNAAVHWTVGDQGKVFKVVDGSITAEYTLGNGDYDLHGVSFVNASYGWIVGYKRADPDRLRGVVFITTSGGGNPGAWTATYPLVQSGINVPFLKVQAVSSNDVWLTCGDGYVLKSTNGGWNWIKKPKPGGETDFSYIWGLWAFDASRAWVASDQSRMIAKTTDGGATWTAYQPFLDDSLSYRNIGHQGYSQADFNNVALAGSKGKIVYTTNGGTNWMEENPLNDVCQWWRGVSQGHSGSGNMWVGTSGTWEPWWPPTGTDFSYPRASKNYDFNDVENVFPPGNLWDIAVGTKAAIYVSHHTFGISEECTLDEIDATSGSGTTVTLSFTFTNTTGVTQQRYIHIWRSICQEDWGTEPGEFYALDGTIGPYDIWDGGRTVTVSRTGGPTDCIYWYGATASVGSNPSPGYSSSPNVDSAAARGRTHHNPIAPPDYFWATDFPNDHGWKMQFEWTEVQGVTQYAVIRGDGGGTHPHYGGHKGGLITVTSSTTNSDSKALPGYQYLRGVRSLDGVTSSLSPTTTYGASVDNIKPPTVTGLTVKYVTELDALEVWWNPIPESGLPGQPETYEPNLGGYWVCPYVAGSALDEEDPHDTHLNHPSPLFRSHYITSISEEAYGHDWCFSVCARDRTGNRGDWCEDVSGTIPNLASTSPLATAYNNGTHLARVPNTATEHVAYESNGEIHYANSTDGGNEWHNRTVLDTGASPAIATNAGGDAWVVYIKDNVVRYKVNASPSGVWGASGVLYDPNRAGLIPGPPAIVLPSIATSHYAYAAFPVYDLMAGASSIKVVKFDETTAVSVTVDTVTNLAMSDSFVSLSLTPGDSIHCCWQRGSAILYSEARVAPAQWRSIVWSTPSVLSQQGTVAKHPFCEAWGDKVSAVWSDQDEGEIMRVERYVAIPNSWSEPQNVSITEEFSDYPQTSTPYAVSWQDLEENGNWELLARAGGDFVTLSSTATGNSRFGHISAQLADPSAVTPSVVYAVWTEGTAQDEYYEVKSATYEIGDSEGQMAARPVRLATTELSSVAPNPFSRTTGIRYQLARPGRTKLSIFDATGREVRTLVNSQQSPGAYSVTWNGTDSRERFLPKGVYFVRFTAPECTGQKKLTLTR